MQHVAAGTTPSSTPATTVDVAARLRRSAADAPERIALRFAGGQLTYGELHARADAACAALLGLGVKPGDRVALVLGTTPTFIEAAAGVLRAGATLVPLLPGLAPDELRYALQDSGATIAVVGPERLDALVELRPQLTELQHLIAADGAGLAPDAPDAPDATGATGAAGPTGDPTDAGGEHVPTWAGLLAAGGEPPLVERSSDDLAALVYTSGTTGRPRGAMLTRGNLAANQDQSLAGRFAVGPDDVVLLVLPLAHIYSLNVGLGASITVGATLVLVERFDPAATLAAVVEHGVTVILGAPPMYVAWLEAGGLEDVDLSAVRLAVSGAAPLPVPVFERFRTATGIAIEEGYGLTEASPSVASTAMGPAARPGSVGLPLPDIGLRLVGDDGEDVVRGDPGEIWVRGPNVFSGYWNDPAGTAEALTPDGWLRTGDIATQDEGGYLYLVDRRRDLILVNGFNVYPREVERVLLDDPSVGQAAVVGSPHPLTGETVVAHVVPRAGEDIEAAALQARCRDQLARYKCPTRIEVVTELPYTATGKVLRRTLRDGDTGR